MNFVGEEHGNGRCHYQVGTTVCILCNVSHLCHHLPHLTVAPDMWNKHRGDHLRRLSFGSSDCTDGGSLDTKQRDPAIHMFAIASNYEAFALTVYSLLAGLHRRDILKQKEIHVRQRQFCKPNFPLIIVSAAAYSALPAAEMCFTSVRQIFGFRLADRDFEFTAHLRTNEAIKCVAPVYWDQTKMGVTSRSTHKLELRKLIGWVLMPPLTNILHRTLVVWLLGAIVAGVGVHSGGVRYQVREAASVCAICFVFLRSVFKVYAAACFGLVLVPLVSHHDDGLTCVLSFVVQRYFLRLHDAGFPGN